MELILTPGNEFSDNKGEQTLPGYAAQGIGSSELWR